jgi:hypothetical protein
MVYFPNSTFKKDKAKKKMKLNIPVVSLGILSGALAIAVIGKQIKYYKYLVN